MPSWIWSSISRVRMGKVDLMHRLMLEHRKGSNAKMKRMNTCKRSLPRSAVYWTCQAQETDPAEW